jgi:hypothetical protein
MIRDGKRLGFLPGWRIFTYVILAIQILMLGWLIASVTSADRHPGCGLLEKMTCTGGTNAGPGIAALFVIAVWIVVTLILGPLWLRSGHDKTRLCRECGEPVAFGAFQCGQCANALRDDVHRYSAYFGRHVPHS